MAQLAKHWVGWLNQKPTGMPEEWWQAVWNQEEAQRGTDILSKQPNIPLAAVLTGKPDNEALADWNDPTWWKKTLEAGTRPSTGAVDNAARNRLAGYLKILIVTRKAPGAAYIGARQSLDNKWRYGAWRSGVTDWDEVREILKHTIDADKLEAIGFGLAQSEQELPADIIDNLCHHSSTSVKRAMSTRPGIGKNAVKAFLNSERNIQAATIGGTNMTAELVMYAIKEKRVDLAHTLAEEMRPQWKIAAPALLAMASAAGVSLVRIRRIVHYGEMVPTPEELVILAASPDDETRAWARQALAGDKKHARTPTDLGAEAARKLAGGGRTPNIKAAKQPSR